MQPTVAEVIADVAYFSVTPLLDGSGRRRYSCLNLEVGVFPRRNRR